MNNFDKFNDELFIIYGINGNMISPDTLIKSLQGFTNILIRIEEKIHPGHPSIIMIEAFETGSFTVKFKELAIEGAKSIVFGLLSSLIWECITEREHVEITKEPVDIRDSLSKEMLKKYDTLRHDRYLKGQIRETFSVVESDASIEYIELSPGKDSVRASIKIHRGEFELVINSRIEPREEMVYHGVVDLVIKQVDVDTKHNPEWVFDFNGKVVSAVIADASIINFSSVKYRYRVGDTLQVTLVETKSSDYYTEQLIHSSFNISKIHKHIPKTL